MENPINQNRITTSTPRCEDAEILLAFLSDIWGQVDGFRTLTNDNFTIQILEQLQLQITGLGLIAQCVGAAHIAEQPCSDS